MHPEPLQPGQNRRQLVSAPAGQANLFNGRNLEIGLGLIVVTHGGSGTRMLQVQTRKPPRTLNHHANIRTDKPTPNSMMTRVQEAGFQPLLIRLAQVDQQHRLGRDNCSATARASPRAKSGRRWPSRSRVLSASCARSVEPPWSNESAPKRPNPTSWHETH